MKKYITGISVFLVIFLIVWVGPYEILNSLKSALMLDQSSL